MRFDIPETTITDLAENLTTYYRGLNYYIEGRVEKIYFDAEDEAVVALVQGSQRYQVRVFAEDEDSLFSYECDCPAFDKYPGLCKHVIAVLKVMQRQEIPITDYTTTAAQNIFDYFEGMRAAASLREVKLEVTLGMESAGWRRNRFYMELRLGEDRLYVVKSIKQLVLALDEGEPINYGKNFTYDPRHHKFSDTNQSILQMAGDLYQSELLAIAVNGYSSNSATVFKGRKLYLADGQVTTLLGLLAETPFIFSFFGKEMRDMQILSVDLPLEFRVKNEDDTLLLSFDSKAPLPVSGNGEYFLYNGAFYKPSASQREAFIPLFNYFVGNNQSTLSFSDSHKGRFASEVLPHIKQIGKVAIDQELADSFYQYDLLTKLYFDKFESGISVKVAFCYGDEIVDPFQAQPEPMHSERILVRDPGAERQILSLLEKAEFKVLKDRVYLEEDDQLFNFLSEVLPELHQLSEIYYSEDFKLLTVRDSRSFSGSVRLNTDTNLLGQYADADLLVTSYPLLRRDAALYRNLEFSFCFLDEAQHIKNPRSTNAKTVKSIRAQGYFALTGTPIENSLTELWSIFDFLMPGYLLTHSEFQRRYEAPIIKQKDKQALEELGSQIRPFILRRMKKDVLKELPAKIENKMVSQLTEEQKRVYLAYLEQAKGEISREISGAGFEKSQIKILSVLTRLRQICCHPGLFIDDYKGGSGKLEMLEELLASAIAGGHRILLFSQFTSMLSIIREYLDKEKIAYFYLDGSTKAQSRGEMVQAFNKGQGSVFLISLKAGGTGLNLTGADMVIHFDPWWNPAVEDQASDRAHRIGQKKVVQVIKLIAQGTIEEKVYELQLKKQELIKAVIQPGETMLNKLTQDEILSLFE